MTIYIYIYIYHKMHVYILVLQYSCILAQFTNNYFSLYKVYSVLVDIHFIIIQKYLKCLITLLLMFNNK